MVAVRPDSACTLLLSVPKSSVIEHDLLRVTISSFEFIQSTPKRHRACATAERNSNSTPRKSKRQMNGDDSSDGVVFDTFIDRAGNYGCRIPESFSMHNDPELATNQSPRPEGLPASLCLADSGCSEYITRDQHAVNDFTPVPTGSFKRRAERNYG